MNYQRRLPPAVPGEDDALDYIRPKEVVDADEDLVMAQVRDGVVGDTRRRPKHAGKNDPAFHEPHWGAGVGLLRGTLAIDRIEALPARFRVGLFAQKAEYPAIARPNYIVDKDAGLAAGRLALKLKYPSFVPNTYAPSGQAHELDLLFAEGSPDVNGVGHAFFLRDARELAMLVTLKPPSLRALGTLLSFRNLGSLATIFKRLKVLNAYTAGPIAKSIGWAGKPYFSLGPFALGDGAMKLCLRPRQAHKLEAIAASGDPAQAQRAAMQAWVAAGQDAVFDLGVQLATPACIPTPGLGEPSKSVMAAEYCDLEWDESKSPYIPVGTLSFPASTQSDLSARFPWSPFQFNAWNTLQVMRPLGQLFRVRKHAHKAHSEARLEHIYDAQPGAMVDKAPFVPGGSS